jgi:hypothetical protein
VSIACLAIALIGCDNESNKSSRGASNTSNTSATDGSSQTQPAGNVQVGSEQASSIDAQDAPNSPRALPRGDALPGWRKLQPVKLFSAAELASAGLDERLQRALKFYPVTRIAKAAYQNGPATASVIFAEADPFDAAGLFTIVTDHPRPIVRPDGSMHGKSGRQTLTAWQGNVFVQISLDSDSNDALNAKAQALMDRIVFALPSEEAPLLIRIVSRERRERCRVWSVRTADALNLVEVDALKKLPASEVNQLLGLPGPATLSVAAIDVVPNDPHLIWVAEYEDAKAAAAAHARYEASLKSGAGGSLGKTTELAEPHGHYLVGTWTKQQETLQPLLPLVAGSLPDGPTTQSTTTSTTPQ